MKPDDCGARDTHEPVTADAGPTPAAGAALQDPGRRRGLGVLLSIGSAPLWLPWHRLHAAVDVVKLRELYAKDFSFSRMAESLAGERVDVAGFMAPPLKANSSFFVLTRRPMSTCPFCESEADWPRDILAVNTRRAVDVLPYNQTIIANGVLELGTSTDPDTGFVSRVRLAQSVVSRG